MTFRAVQGSGGALLFPAALAIVVQTFPLRERGKALAIFFGIAGGLTAVGPCSAATSPNGRGGPSSGSTSPSAVIALVLIAVSQADHRPTNRPAWTTGGWPSSWPASALSVFGFQQASIWGWHNPAIGLSIADWLRLPGGLLPRRASHRIAAHAGADLPHPGRSWSRTWSSASPCSPSSRSSSSPPSTPRSSLGKTAPEAGLFLLYFFAGFVVGRPDRWPDARPARRQAPGGARVRRRRCRASASGRARSPTLSFSASAVVRRGGRRGHGLHARPGQHRRRQPCVEPLLRRGHRASPRRCETTPPAWAWPSSAPCW